jgi:hypothetical protein
MGSLGGMVRHGDDEQAARSELARFFRSIGKLMLIDSAEEPEQSQPDQQESEGEQHNEGGSA